ncbi:hypothetical protein [Halosimplex rubrum]|nr:hypothetical protein [Halosimplex rubrum]
MSKWSDVDEQRIWEGLVVQSHGPDDVDALEYLRRGSRADDGRGA